MKKETERERKEGRESEVDDIKKDNGIEKRLKGGKEEREMEECVYAFLYRLRLSIRSFTITFLIDPEGIKVHKMDTMTCPTAMPNP